MIRMLIIVQALQTITVKTESAIEKVLEFTSTIIDDSAAQNMHFLNDVDYTLANGTAAVTGDGCNTLQLFHLTINNFR